MKRRTSRKQVKKIDREARHCGICGGFFLSANPSQQNPRTKDMCEVSPESKYQFLSVGELRDKATKCACVVVGANE